MPKYTFRKELKNIPHDKFKKYIEDQIFSSPDFNKHIKQTSINLNINEDVVREVVQHYFLHIGYAINTVRKIKTKINIFGYFSLFVEKGRRI